MTFTKHELKQGQALQNVNLFKHTMTANLPINLTEAIGRSELDDLMEVALRLNQTPETVILSALRDYLAKKKAETLTVEVEA